MAELKFEFWCASALKLDDWCEKTLGYVPEVIHNAVPDPNNEYIVLVHTVLRFRSDEDALLFKLKIS